jgi:Protein of unknown function (DUF1488)
MVDITFPNSNPTYCGTSLTLSCPATVNGNRSQYSVTAEALEAYCAKRIWCAPLRTTARASSNWRTACSN